jgi:hypothetical protein
MTLDLQPARDALARFRGAPSATDEERSRWGRDDFLAHGQDRRDHYLRHAPGVAAELEHLLAALSSPPADDVHPAHTGHRFGGGYARASAMLAGDPDWMNATGGAPADDVRGELMAVLLRNGHADWDSLDASVVADAILSDPRFEVRLRGTVTEPTEATREALLAVRDEIVRNEGRADAACLATLEAIAAGIFPRGTVTDADDAETKAQIIADLAESYAYVHAVSRTSSQVYKWLMSRSAAAREARS